MKCRILSSVSVIVNIANCVNEPSNHIEFVVNGKLNGHYWCFKEQRLYRGLSPLTQVMVDHNESVRPKREENQERKEIEIEHKIRKRGLIKQPLAKESRNHGYHPATVSLRISSVSFRIASCIPSSRCVRVAPEGKSPHWEKSRSHNIFRSFKSVNATRAVMVIRRWETSSPGLTTEDIVGTGFFPVG